MTAPRMFTVVVHEAEEGGYWAEVAELPGCVSQGETLDELKDNIMDAIEDCLNAQVEDGDGDPTIATWSVPNPQKGSRRKEGRLAPA